MIIRHKKLPIIFEYKDSDWKWASDFIIKELNESGWMNYTILPNDNPNQLELFDTIDFQTKDRFGREMTDYAKMIYRGQASGKTIEVKGRIVS